MEIISLQVSIISKGVAAVDFWTRETTFAALAADASPRCCVVVCGRAGPPPWLRLLCPSSCSPPT